MAVDPREALSRIDKLQDYMLKEGAAYDMIARELSRLHWGAGDIYSIIDKILDEVVDEMADYNALHDEFDEYLAELKEKYEEMV